MATDKQRVAFFKLWGRARADVCDGYGIDRGDRGRERDARHRWIRECTNGRTDNINAVRPGAEFAALMLKTAEAAGDYAEAAYWTVDAAKRRRWGIEQLLRQIGEITREPRPWAYARGVLSRMRLPEDWMDVPERDLAAVFQALDTHRRRILKRDHGWRGRRDGSSPTLAFVPGARYVWTGGRLELDGRACLPNPVDNPPAGTV